MTSVELHATETDIEGPLYEAAKKVYPQSVKGPHRRIKWGLLIATLTVYYLLPFVRWYRGPNEPSQAVLIDLEHRRFFFFFIEIWPQEVYYLTGLLILAALVLFLMNAMAGRIWCGYLCPQTVWTDLFLLVERWAEGDRRERMLKDASPWTLERVAEKVLKHSCWLLIAWWTGGAWVLYFSDAPTLVWKLLTFEGSFSEYMWIGILTLTTYVFAGHMREQVCLYMCPWPRIQAALTDENALNVTYRVDLGEPRTSAKKAIAARAHGAIAGDCIDCHQCVAVCPTGVDIREGSQMGCIQCGLCIDACANVMDQLDRPVRLIGYDTDLNLKRRIEGKRNAYKPFRARTMVYIVLIVAIAGVMTWSLATRSNASISAMHDRNPQYVMLSDGSIRNAYTLRFVNKLPDANHFTLSVSGLEGATLDVVGMTTQHDGEKAISIGPDTTLEVRAIVTRPAGAHGRESTPIIFTTKDAQGVVATAPDFFKAPEDHEQGEHHDRNH